MIGMENKESQVNGLLVLQTQMLQHYKDYWSNLEDVPFQITESVQEFINIPFSCFEGTIVL